MSARKIWLALALTCAVLVTMLPSAATAGSVRYGHTHRGDGVLHAGCHTYRAHYRLRPDNVFKGKGNGGSWAAEFFLKDPRHRGVATDIKEYQADPRRGRVRFKFCRNTTRPGRFTIRGRLTVKYTSCTTPLTCTHHKKSVWIKPSHFRLRRR